MLLNNGKFNKIYLKEYVVGLEVYIDGDWILENTCCFGGNTFRALNCVAASVAVAGFGL